jgi:hypothetical protein
MRKAAHTVERIVPWGSSLDNGSMNELCVAELLYVNAEEEADWLLHAYYLVWRREADRIEAEWLAEVHPTLYDGPHPHA